MGIGRNIALVSLSLIFVIGFASSSSGQIQDSIVVTTDKSSYSEGEIVRITGKVRDLYSGTPVSVTVTAPNDDLVSITQVQVGADKKFNTEITTGGALMEFAGTYTVVAQYGNASRSATTSFEFGGSTTATTNGGDASGCLINSFTLPIVVLDRLPFTVIDAGETIVFTGRLVCENGYKHSNVEIIIFENHLLSNDETLITTHTDSNGEFSVSWIATTNKSIREPTAIQAKYETELLSTGLQYKPTSEKYYLQIDRLLSEISLDPLPKSAEIGEILFFTGKLELESGSPEGYIVYIKDEDPWEGDDFLATGYVESDGSFSANWIVAITDDDRIVDVYAVFEGAHIYWRVTTCDYGITKPLGGACQETIPLQITGERVIPIDSDGDGITDKIDQCPRQPETFNNFEDSDGCPDINPQNLDSDGDGITDSYDQCPLVSETFNGYQDSDGCPDTKPSDPQIIDSDGDGITDDKDQCKFQKETFNGYQDSDGCPEETRKLENLSPYAYMEYFYSLDLTKSPIVAVSPSPDVYNELIKFNIPIQEAVLIWGDTIKREFGGNWNVDFLIIEPNSRLPSKPDIIVNVVTREDDDKCQKFAGYADIYASGRILIDGKMVEPKKPINVVVCAGVAQFNFYSSTTNVAGTATHEFIHAMGLGHTFNKSGDLMCSVEYVDGKWIPTCSSSFFGSKSRIPLDFNIIAVANLYGTDGFLIPNNDVLYREKFSADQYRNFGIISIPSSESNYQGGQTTSGIYDAPTPTPITPTPITPTPITPTPTTPTKPIPSFVDPYKDPWDYVVRYDTESEYKKWFDKNYPEYTIYEAVGLPEPTETKLPNWIKNNAAWWSSNALDDRDFSKGIEYMIKEGIIRIPQVQTEKDMGSFSVGKIPDWIKNNAKWWSEGLLSDEDFAKGLEYMVKEGIIKI